MICHWIATRIGEDLLEYTPVATRAHGVVSARRVRDDIHIADWKPINIANSVHVVTSNPT